MSVSVYIYLYIYKPITPYKVVAIFDPRDFIWTNLNLLVPGMLHVNIVLFLAAVLERNIFLSIFLYHL